MHVSRLPDAVTPVLSLRVHGWVPVRVVEDDGIGSSQVHAQTTAARREDEAEDTIVAVEALHQRLAALDRGRSVQTQVGVAVEVEEDLQHVQHARHLREDEGSGEGGEGGRGKNISLLGGRDECNCWERGVHMHLVKMSVCEREREDVSTGGPQS